MQRTANPLAHRAGRDAGTCGVASVCCLVTIAAAAGCSGPRQIEGWQREALFTHAATGESINRLLPGGVEPGAEQRARETLRTIYFATSRLDYLAKNEASVKRNEADWAAMTEAVREAYAALRDAADLPIDELALGEPHPPIAAALERVTAIERRFGGSPPPGVTPARIRP